jgi:capsular polysaccharide biosynthesis protein
VNEDPISPQWNVNLAFGVILGLVAGIGYVVMRHLSDRTVRTKAEAVEVTV